MINRKINNRYFFFFFFRKLIFIHKKNADDRALLAITPPQAKYLLNSLQQAARAIGLFVNSDKTELMCFDQNRTISSLNGQRLKFDDQFY